MKVTWQADDIKAGLHVARNISRNCDHVILYQMSDDGVRYCLTLKAGQASASMTKEEMATYLNERGYKPAVLLTL